MLVLTRKVGEAIVIAEEVTVTVLSIRGDQARLGVSAPRDIDVDRREVRNRRRQEAAPTPSDHRGSG